MDAIERELAGLESLVARVRARQMVLLMEADRRQAPMADGCRSLVEWTTGRLDVAPETATALVRTARGLVDHPTVATAIASGEISFDRTVECSQLAALHTEDPVEAGLGHDIVGLRHLVAARRRVSRHKARERFRGRYVVMQPALADGMWKLWGRLTAGDGEILDAALTDRADRLPSLPDGTRDALTHRRADALVAIASDGLDSQAGSASPPVVSLFVDANRVGSTGTETGVVTEHGLAAGPDLAEEVLCDARIQTIVTGGGQPLAAGRTRRTISPTLRRAILHRDGHACAADGCRSRYRLQVHHKIPWSNGGATNPGNLTTLCWYHHHVVIHGMGYRIDPDSPPQRLRFTKTSGPDPP